MTDNNLVKLETYNFDIQLLGSGFYLTLYTATSQLVESQEPSLIMHEGTTQIYSAALKFISRTWKQCNSLQFIY